MALYIYRCPACLGQGVSLNTLGVSPLCLSHPQPLTMDRVPDTERVLLPIGEAIVPPSIGPLKVATLRAAGILMPETQHALEWLYRHRATNGMAAAFVRVGGRRCIDLVAFAKLMRGMKA